MLRRRRPLLRAAVAGGAGYMAGKKIQQGREDDAERDARIDDLEGQQAAAARPQQSTGISDAAIAQLKQLAELKDQGILTEEEFNIQKAKILAGS